MTETLNPFVNAQRQIKKSCNMYKSCENNENQYELLSHPRRILKINIPVRMDNWKIKFFIGYRVQHNNARWPFKWWIRFHQDVNLYEVKALSIWMSFKCAVIDIPLWWAKWWVIVNPKELSENELERLARWYVREIYKYLWPDTDVPAPDINTNPKIMAWMMDEYSRLVGKYSPSSFTGKPLSCGGSKWRWKATAQGWLYVLEESLRQNNDSLNWKKIIIQWAWNAGLTMAKLLKDKWIKLVGISDSKWWIYNKNWLDIDKIVELKSSRKSVIEYENTTKITNQEILEQDCDILIPAALENQITEENADKIKAQIVLELANWPTIPEADEILFNKNISVIPDILANAGWVMVSYFEQVQNITNFYWEEEEIEEKLYKKITIASKKVWELAKEENTNLRNAAYIISMKRILDAMKDRGEF